MRVVIAPQGFKGTLSGMAAAEAMRSGVLRALPDSATELVPMADGGHGTLDALLDAAGGKRRWLDVTGPVGETVHAAWGTIPGGVRAGNGRSTAVIEMAQASGLTVVPEARRDPLLVSTSRSRWSRTNPNVTTLTSSEPPSAATNSALKSSLKSTVSMSAKR